MFWQKMHLIEKQVKTVYIDISLSILISGKSQSKLKIKKVLSLFSFFKLFLCVLYSSAIDEI